MSGAFGTPPPSQVALDTYSTNLNLIEKANMAVWEALRTVADSNDPIGPLLFGVDQPTLKAFAGAQKSKILPILQTSVPIFSIRLASPDAVSAMTLVAGYNATKIFGHLMETFGGELPMKHFVPPMRGAALSPSNVVVDMHSANAKLIEQSNLAIWDAINAVAASEDPLGSVLFNVSDETLQAFYQCPKSKILAIFQTGVPIWSVRIASADAVKELTDAGGYNTDKLFAGMLKAFGDKLPLKRSN